MPTEFPLDPMEHPLDRAEHRLDPMKHPLDRAEHRLDPMKHPLDRAEHPLDPTRHPLDQKRRRLSAKFAKDAKDARKKSPFLFPGDLGALGVFGANQPRKNVECHLFRAL
jgi:hypothetical protein